MNGKHPECKGLRATERRVKPRISKYYLIGTLFCGSKPSYGRCTCYTFCSGAAREQFTFIQEIYNFGCNGGS